MSVEELEKELWSISLKDVGIYNIFGNEEEDEVFIDGKPSLKALEPNVFEIDVKKLYRLSPCHIANMLFSAIRRYRSEERRMWRYSRKRAK